MRQNKEMEISNMQTEKMRMEAIYKDHAQTVYRYLLGLCGNALLAEELTQETFYRAVYSLKNYNGSCKISGWLCQIAKHIWYQEIAKNKKMPTEPIPESLPAAESSPEEKSVAQEEKLHFYKALHALPEPMREVAYLRLLGEFSFKEIGAVLGKNENWARVTFYRAKQKLVKGEVNNA